MGKPIQQLAKELADKTINKLLDAMSLDEQERKELSLATMSQFMSTDWMEQRRSRITASNSKRVYTRAKTLLVNPEEDPSSVVGTIMRYTQSPMTEAMQYGISTEINAKLKFAQLMQQMHVGYEQDECGLLVLPKRPYIAATPDLLISCLCHGEGLCEIKCPYTIKEETRITPENYSHLKRLSSGQVTLKKSSPYYFQIQH